MATWSNRVGPSPDPLSPIDGVDEEATELLKEKLKEVLDTRPAIAAASGVRPSTSQSLRRKEKLRRSLPHRTKPVSNEAIRRTSSLTHLDAFAEEGQVNLNLELQDVSTEPSLSKVDSRTGDQMSSGVSFDKERSLRQSSLHLRHRVVQQ